MGNPLNGVKLLIHKYELTIVREFDFCCQSADRPDGKKSGGEDSNI